MEEKIGRILEILEKWGKRSEKEATRAEEKDEKMKELQEIFTEQVDSVFRRYVSGQMSEWEFNTYMNHLSHEGLKDAVKIALSMLKAEEEEMFAEQLDEDVEKVDFQEMIREQLDEEEIQEIVELDGLANKFLNNQIEMHEFIDKAQDYSKLPLAGMYAAMVKIIKRAKE